MERPKVFGIGFHKTGTKSLGTALSTLGYRVAGPFGVQDPDIALNALPRALQAARRFDAFQDNPWPILFREMDGQFPGSRFVLTVRPDEKWLASAMRHFGKQTTPMRTWIYGRGAPAGARDTYLARYRKHNADVRAHFRDRPDDLLVLDIFAGEGWEKLCPFLGVPVPDKAFPHVNAGRTEAGDKARQRARR